MTAAVYIFEPSVARRSNAYITGMTVDLLLNCVIVSYNSVVTPVFWPHVKGAHVDLLSQHIKSDFVFLFFATSAAWHIL